MIVRPAKPGDEAAVYAIIEACGLAMPDISYANWTGILLVAERQSEIIGFIQALPGKPYAVICEMGVLPAHQKGRAAVKLIESAELILRSMGCTTWAAWVGEKRPDVHAVVSHWGARESGAGSIYYRSLL
jgi:hypothetical protein